MRFSVYAALSETHIVRKEFRSLYQNLDVRVTKSATDEARRKSIFYFTKRQSSQHTLTPSLHSSTSPSFFSFAFLWQEFCSISSRLVSFMGITCRSELHHVTLTTNSTDFSFPSDEIESPQSVEPSPRGN